MKNTLEKKNGILVVSFGTSHPDTCEKTIGKLERMIAAAFPQWKQYRAWTSKIIIRKLKNRDNISVMTVSEALEAMDADGITDVILQPTHVINGIENDTMKEEALAFADRFDSICFGEPLLSSEEDQEAVSRVIIEEFSFVKENEALILMGHGTMHYANSIYAALDYRFKDQGHPNIHIGTVEGYPTTESLLRILKHRRPEKLYLAPFMIVAGDHAKNDMAGEEEDSWKNIFENAGYRVECIIRGMGEYDGIGAIYVEHIRNAMEGKILKE